MSVVALVVVEVVETSATRPHPQETERLTSDPEE